MRSSNSGVKGILGKLRTEVLSPSSGSRGLRDHGPPGPVKIGHKKDGHRRQLHRFNVSWPPLTPPLDPLLSPPQEVQIQGGAFLVSS